MTLIQLQKEVFRPEEQGSKVRSARFIRNPYLFCLKLFWKHNNQVKLSRGVREERRLFQE